MSISNNTFSFTLFNDLSELKTLTERLEAAGVRWKLSQKIVLQLNLILDELFTNIVKYGCSDDREHEIDFQLVKLGNELKITIVDDGCDFDITGAPDPDLTTPLAKKEIGGMGIFLARKYVDEFKYRRQGRKNIVTLIKKIS